MLLIRNADVFALHPSGVQDLLLGGGKILWMGRGQELLDFPAALRAHTQSLDLAGARAQ